MSEPDETMPTPGAAVYRYDPEKNPDGASLPGVPLRDLTESDVARIPKWLRKSLKECPFYVAAKPRAPAKE